MTAAPATPQALAPAPVGQRAADRVNEPAFPIEVNTGIGHAQPFVTELGQQLTLSPVGRDRPSAFLPFALNLD
jgi:hypothetical protein